MINDQVWEREIEEVRTTASQPTPGAFANCAPSLNPSPPLIPAATRPSFACYLPLPLGMCSCCLMCRYVTPAGRWPLLAPRVLLLPATLKPLPTVIHRARSTTGCCAHVSTLASNNQIRRTPHAAYESSAPRFPSKRHRERGRETSTRTRTRSTSPARAESSRRRDRSHSPPTAGGLPLYRQAQKRFRDGQRGARDWPGALARTQDQDRLDPGIPTPGRALRPLDTQVLHHAPGSRRAEAHPAPLPRTHAQG